MIFDKLKNAKNYYSLSENLKIGFEFLLNTDLSSLKDGKHLIKGDDVFINVQTLKTKPVEEKKWEAHRKYIDIQYVIKGSEKMGFGLIDDFKTLIPYDPDKDLEFLEGEKYNFINVNEGEFSVFYPEDIHAPMLAYDKPTEIKKVIVKVKI